MRNLIVGALTAGILPLINLIGVAATNAIAAAIAWMGFVCVGLSFPLHSPPFFPSFRPVCLILIPMFMHACVSSLLVCTIRYGAAMREWVDVGYSTLRYN